MLKITSHTTQAETTLRLEGRLAGAWVQELEQSWRHMTAAERGALVVDLRGVTFIEETGKALLAEMWRDGAEFIAAGCCTKPMVEQIASSGQRTKADRRKKDRTIPPCAH